MDSYSCLESLAKRVTHELIVTNLGGVAREWFHIRIATGISIAPTWGTRRRWRSALRWRCRIGG